MLRLTSLLLTAMTLAGCAGQADGPTATSTPTTARTTAPATPSIDWQDWAPTAFDQAQREGSLILVDVGIEGCTACRWMDERTYTNRRRVVGQLDRAYHDPSGGWGRRQKLPLGPNVAHALLRAHARGSEAWERRALHTLERYTALVDPMWGGVFVAALGEDWGRIIPEKRIAGQAAALSGFARAHHLTGDRRWLRRAADIDRYVEAFMLSPDGAFYTSQEDDAPDLPSGLDAYAYYTTLDDAGRRAYGVPPVDHAIYTDKNALMIAAYIDLYEASGDQAALDRARRAATSMLDRQGEDGLFVQHDGSNPDGDERMRSLPGGDRRYLRPQGPIGLALLDLFRATAEPRWLAAAERLADGLGALEDPEHGGWLASSDDSTAAVLGRRKPLEANAMAARFVLELGVYTKDEQTPKRAERAIRAVSVPAVLEPEGRLAGELALAIEWLTTGAVEISVLGDPSDPRTQALYAAARASYEPRKVLHHEPPGRYPDPGVPAIYVCSEEACSPAITDADAVSAEVAKFARNRAE